ncbi:MAG TPA: hypothetical protein VKA08_14615 [Balneolales bacterium]|nr:hypothetical protein [Balneolales bacterium]
MSNNIELTDERAIDLLLFKIVGSNGDINYDETEEINSILEQFSYDPHNFQHTLNYLNGLTTKQIKDAVERGIDYIAKKPGAEKKRILTLLDHLARKNTTFMKSHKDILNEIRTKIEIV